MMRLFERTFFILLIIALAITTAIYGKGQEEVVRLSIVEKNKLSDTIHDNKKLIDSLFESKIKDFSEENLLEELINLKVKFPHLVLAQSKFETGNFSSGIFKHNRNLFGMRVPGNRSTTAIGERKGFAIYKDWRHSVYDYAMWQAQFVSQCRTEEDYLKRLASYAGYKEYGQHIKHLK